MLFSFSLLHYEKARVYMCVNALLENLYSPSMTETDRNNAVPAASTYEFMGRLGSF